jgi:methylene-fatty-acyl-phospholipid synthase
MSVSFDFHSFVDISKTSLTICLLSIAFNPTAWNIVARNGECHMPCRLTAGNYSGAHPRPKEYRNKTITRIFGGNQYYGCYFLTVLIFSFGIFRDHLYVFQSAIDARRVILMSEDSYSLALTDQPRISILPEPYAIVIPAALFIVGWTFVITSIWALGITGTFLGDYFGILMDHRVEGCVLSPRLSQSICFSHIIGADSRSMSFATLCMLAPRYASRLRHSGTNDQPGF